MGEHGGWMEEEWGLGNGGGIGMEWRRDGQGMEEGWAGNGG